MEFTEISFALDDSDGWMSFKAVVPGVEFLLFREESDGREPRRCRRRGWIKDRKVRGKRKWFLFARIDKDGPLKSHHLPLCEVFA